MARALNRCSRRATSRTTVERHVPWPRERQWRPGEPITLVEDRATITYRLRGVMRDADPGSAYALVTLEPVRTLAAIEEESLPAVG